jgi:hypothetical protein
MGRVLIWAQWLIIVAGVLLSPLLVLFMVGVIGLCLFRKAWRAGLAALQSRREPTRSAGVTRPGVSSR